MVASAGLPLNLSPFAVGRLRCATRWRQVHTALSRAAQFARGARACARWHDNDTLPGQGAAVPWIDGCYFPAVPGSPLMDS